MANLCYYPALLLRSTFCALCWLLWLAVGPGRAADKSATSLHTVGGGHNITQIHLTGIYFLPPDRAPIPDWRERLSFFLDRAAKFHERELAGQSRVVWEIRSAPYVSQETHPPTKDVNEWYWRIANEVRTKAWTRKPQLGFPIVLIFADNNFCNGYNEWTRMCDPEKCTCDKHDARCNGHVTGTGEERPGTNCGGSRAVYWKEQNMGLGLISGDGWRVPLIGSDCVVYHEGIGHTIGLPHPEPMNKSVMGLAQYHTSLNMTTLDDKQKESLGWKPGPLNNSSLFSVFSTGYIPLKPTINTPIIIAATFSPEKAPYHVVAQYQTEFGAWSTLPPPRRKSATTTPKDVVLEWILPPFEKPCLVSYRIIAASGLGEREQQWNVIRVGAKEGIK